jgi:hypothetical protein
MENQAGPSKTLTPSSMPEEKRAERLGWIIDQLATAAIAKGQTHTPERLRINAEDLIDIPQADLAAAFDQARRELDYVPQVSELRRLALADESGKLDAETRAAWDVLLRFVDKWCRWNDGYFDGESGHVVSARVEEGAPQLPQRIVDTVRRTGGWAVYLRMEPRDFPFQQKRFFDEYKAWIRVEHALPDLAKVLQLPESPAPAQPKQLAAPIIDADYIKPFPPPTKVPEPLTSEQLRDRREMLRQQIETLKAKRGRPEETPESGLPIPLINTAADAGQETVQ